MTATATAVTRPRCSLRSCTSFVVIRGMCDNHSAKLRRVEKLAGLREPVPAAGAARHLHRLRARGWSWGRIATAARSSTPLLHRVAAGEVVTLPPRTARGILDVVPVWVPSRVPVDATGSRRRLSGLAWQGWSNQAVADQVGISAWCVRNSSRTGRVSAATAAKIAEFYDGHAYQPGPDLSYARKARTLGAVPAAAWDDDTIDDPDAQPVGHQPDAADGGVDLVAVEAIISGRLQASDATVEERRAAVVELTGRGVSAVRIGLLLRMSPRSVVRLRSAA